jgi:outer membrane protein TolC
VQDKIIESHIAEEKKDQINSSVLPTVSINSDHLWNEKKGLSESSSSTYSRSAYLNVSQPLFQGGSEYYALGAAQLLPRLAELEIIQEKITLFRDISFIYFEIIKLEHNQTTLLNQQKLLEERVSTLLKRAKIGRNKRTDVLSAKTGSARVSAELAQVESALIEAKQRLKILTGLNTIGELEDQEKLKDLQIPESWDTELMNSPLIKIEQLKLEYAQKEVSMTEGKFFPSVDLDSNYYADRDGNLKNSKWDVGINIKLDLYSGGEDASKKTIKIYQQKKRELILKDLLRNLQQQFDSLKEEFLKQKDVVKKLNQAIKLTSENNLQYIKEANKGLVSQLDVLRALEEHLLVQKAYDEQVYLY